jgi:hypothetical protein
MKVSVGNCSETLVSGQMGMDLVDIETAAFDQHERKRK